MSVKDLRFSILALAFGFLFMTGAKSSMAQSTTKTTIKDQPIEVVVTQCEAPYEPITFTGFQNSVYEVKNDHNGSPLRFKSTVSWEHVVGTTPSGAIYKGKSKYKEEADLDGLPSYHRLTSSERFKSKTKGAPDMEVTLKLRIKVDENGTVTEDKESQTAECKP